VDSSALALSVVEIPIWFRQEQIHENLPHASTCMSLLA